jgi:hypothetical protein
MRGLVLVCVLTACNDPGLLLEVHAAGDAPMASVEVMIADDIHGGGMGMPPKQSPKSAGKVYEVLDTTTAEVSDGTAKVLLQAGAIDAIPGLLVVGKDASGGINGYAVITDPNSSDGLIHIRHTKSDEIVVHLDPVTQMPLAQVRMPSQTDRLARWSQDGDANDGRCIGIIHPDGRGEFFGPEDDTDCDAADPECDDTWFLHTASAGSCPTTMPPTNDDTMDACRIGTTLGCTDNVTQGSDCTATPSSVCVPAEVCTSCPDLDPGCLAGLTTDNQSTRIDCTIFVTNADPPALCTTLGEPALISLHGFIGVSSVCAGVPGLLTDISTSSMPMSTVPLSSTTAMLGFTCAPQGVQGVNMAVIGNSDQVDPAKMPTDGALVVRVNEDGTATGGHVLALPFHAHLDSVDGCPTTGSIVCTVEDGVAASNGEADPIWHCAGN